MVDSSADMKDEAGWKLLTGDVFRSPNRAKGLAVHVSHGQQPHGVPGHVSVGRGLRRRDRLLPTQRPRCVNTLAAWSVSERLGGAAANKKVSTSGNSCHL